MAFEGMPLFTGLQLGVDARALLVFHTPPPAAPIKTAQLLELQVGATAIAVVRPPKTVAEVPAVDSLTTMASAGTPLGPRFCQFAGVAAGRFAIALAAFAAASCWAALIHFFG